MGIEQPANVQTFAEKVDFITNTLRGMGYTIMTHEERNGVSLSGFDSALNYIELLDLDIFTIGAAMDWVSAVWLTRTMALKSGMEATQAKMDALSDAEKAVLWDGIKRMVEAQQAQEAEETPAVVPDVPESLSTALLEVFTSVEGANDWLDTPAPTLGDRKPRELLAEGHLASVEGALEALASGIYI